MTSNDADFDGDGPTLPDSRTDAHSPFDGEGRLRVGAKIGGRYRIEAMVGEGAMGAVYRAHRDDLDAPFAVKLMSREIAKVPGAVDRFVREARAAARVRHDHVVRVVDTGIVGELPYLVMEFLEGRALDSALEDGSLSPAAAVAVALPVIAAVDAAHEAGVIHRDLKPANVFLSDGPAGNAGVKVVDFGISKIRNEDAQLTQTGEFVGTPGYAAPEQLMSARDVGVRADQYSIGVTLYEALSGVFPFAAGSSYEIIHKVLSGEAKPLSEHASVPDGLAAVVGRAMQPAPEDRFESMRAFGRALMPFADAGTRARWAPVFGGASAPERKEPRSAPSVMMLLAVAATLALVAALGFIAWGGADGTDGTDGAEVAEVAPDDSPDPVPTIAASDGATLRLGLSADVTHERLANDYVPLSEYLAEALGRPVELVTLRSYDRLGRGLGEGDIDVAWLPPYDYVRAADGGTDVLLLGRPVEGEDRSSYQGVIVALVEEGAPSSLEELRGGTFCYVNPTSSSGYLYPRVMLGQHGLDPDALFSSTRFVGNHNGVLPAIHAGDCAAGATYAGMLYEAQERVNLPPQDFTILESTGPIPYGPYVARTGLDEGVVSALRDALLSLVPGSEAAGAVFDEAAGIRGFEPAADADYEMLRVVHEDALGSP